jgi:uncharacterized membrane protein YccC
MQVVVREIIFTLKTFAGAMLAMFISFLLDLEKPSWAILTAYIVAQPFAGMVQSKALYRVAGTLAGGVVAVAALGNLSSSSTILALVLALWLGICVYFAVLDRTARSYAFMLAGYTASIIVFPAVDTPAAIFDIAVSRCEEIIIGIICAVVANQVIFPQSAGAALQHRIDSWMGDARQWIVNVLQQKSQGEAALAEQNNLITQSLLVNTLQEHAAYDTPILRSLKAWIYDLQRRVHSVMGVLNSIEDRLSILRRERPDLLTGKSSLLQRVVDYIASDPQPDPTVRDQLFADIEHASSTDPQVLQDSHLLLLTTVIDRLKDLMRFWDECRFLHRMIAERRPAPRPPSPLAVHRDHLMALLAAMAAAIAILVCNAFWVYSAWPSGAGAVIMAGVLCSLFAAADNSAELTVKFFNGTVIGTVIAVVFVLFLLPPINGMVPLMAVLSLFYLPCGVMLASTRQAPAALPIILAFTTTVVIQNNYTMPFDSFLNNGIANILGIAAAAIVLRLFRSIGSDWIIRRLIDATRRDLARVAVADRGFERPSFESRMFDRLNGLLMRRRPGLEQQDIIRGSLAALRVGLNLFLFQTVEGNLSLTARRSARLARADLARLFHRGQSSFQQLEQVAALLQATVNDIAIDPLTAETKQAVLALGGIRLLLLGHAAFFCRVAPTKIIASQDMVAA